MTTKSALCVASKITSSGTAPKASRARRGKASMARPTARPLKSSSSPQVVPPSIPGARQPGWPPRLPPLDLVRTRPPQRRWLRRPNLLRLNHLDGVATTTCTFACREKGWRQWIWAHRDGAAPGVSERWATECSTSSSLRSGAAAGTRVAAVMW